MNITEERLKKELNRCVTILSEKYKPERILVFGSLASGEVNENSDIDMIIIKSTSKPFLKRIEEVLRILKPKEVFDIFVYTPDEFKRLSETRLFFKKEILPKAKEIYNARRGEGMAKVR